MKLQEFNGGLATRLNPHLINLNEAVVYSNIDNATGSLSPVKDKLATGETCSRFNFYSNALQRWFTSSTYKYWVDFGDSVYDSDRAVTTATGSHSMGITVPVNTLSSNVTSVPKITGVTISPEVIFAPEALPSSVLQYALVNVHGGVYSEPLYLTIPVQDYADVRVTQPTVRNGTLIQTTVSAEVAKDLTRRELFFTSPRASFIGDGTVKVYRQYKGAFHYVNYLADEEDFFFDSVEDIGANEVLDLDLMYPLKGVYQYVLTYYDNALGRESGPSEVSAEVQVPTSGRVQLNSLPVSPDPSVTHKRLYRVGGSTTLFTLVAQIDNTTTSYTDVTKDADLLSTTLTTETDLPAPAEIKYLTSANTMLFGAVGSRLVFTPIGKPESWPALYFVEFDATITSVAVVYSGVLVCTIDKTYIVTGSGPTSLSKSILSLDQGCTSHSSMQVLKGTAIWVSADGICTSSGEAVSVVSKLKLGTFEIVPEDSALVAEVYYVLYGNTVLSFDTALGGIFKQFALGVDSLAKKGTSLYGHSSGARYKLFGASSNLPLAYKSPKFIEGRYTENKLYKKVYIYSKGDIIVNIFINDTLVTTKTLATEDNHTILVPQESQRGNCIQFEIHGTGEVLEIEYEAGRNSPDGGK